MREALFLASLAALVIGGWKWTTPGGFMTWALPVIVLAIVLAIIGACIKPKE